MIGQWRTKRIDIRGSEAALRALGRTGVPIQTILRQHYCSGDAKDWNLRIANAKGAEIVSNAEISGNGTVEAIATVKDLQSTRVLLKVERDREVRTGRLVQTLGVVYGEPEHAGEVRAERQRETRGRKVEGPVQGY
jgi:hypothetical protein